MRGVFLERLSWPEAKTWFDKDPLVIIPIGAAAKEHGHHLPLNTDYLTARTLARRVAEALPVVIAPVLGFAYYPAFRHYPGSQHLSPETFMAVIGELLEGFIDQGIQQLAVINTGVSTEAPLLIAVRELYERRRVRVAVADIRRLGHRADPLFEQKLGGHGDEHETSVILAIDPERVRMERTETDYGHLLDHPKTVFYQPALFDGDPDSGIDFSATGVRGDPTLASREKGVAALDAMVEDLIQGLQALYPQAVAIKP